MYLYLYAIAYRILYTLVLIRCGNGVSGTVRRDLVPRKAIPKYFILTILEGSLLNGEAWDVCNERANTLLQSPHTPTEAEMKEQMQHTADAFAVDMLVSKFIQGIPVVGVVGGLTNPMYYRKTQLYVRLKYQKRFLMTKSA